MSSPDPVAGSELSEVRVGAQCQADGSCTFVVWAPERKRVELKLALPEPVSIPLDKDARGYWRVRVPGVPPGALYIYRLDGHLERPDPASHSQPHGVHGPSQVVDHRAYSWQDRDWQGLDPGRMIIYEVHTGTFTPQGSFEAIIPRLPALRKTGINTLELMPVAQFPGERNWGYDGVYPFAVHDAYGGARSLKRLVDACHHHGLAVVLDVVYNHLGPEGNYLHDFGPYFTDKYKTPWGEAINLDDACCDEVRNFFIQNALFWFSVFHIDGLRLDAVHAMVDMSARPFLQELTGIVREFSRQDGRMRLLIAESDSNDARLITPAERGGYGLDALWCDDFHHSLHALITGETQGYYADFGQLRHLVHSLREGFAYTGGYSPYRKRRHGNASRERPAQQFIVCAQNHDQVGNRLLGERLSLLVDFESQKLCLAVVLLSPFIPLLFMGEEYGETAPFQYFVSHADAALVAAISTGRRKEFSSFHWQGSMPPPHDPATYLGSKIRWERRTQGRHQILQAFTRALITLRQNDPSWANLDKDRLRVEGWEEEKILVMQRGDDLGKQMLCLFNFNTSDIRFSTAKLSLPGGWRRGLDSAEERWGGGASLLPAELPVGPAITLRRRSAAVYHQGEWLR